MNFPTPNEAVELSEHHRQLMLDGLRNKIRAACVECAGYNREYSHVDIESQRIVWGITTEEVREILQEVAAVGWRAGLKGHDSIYILKPTTEWRLIGMQGWNIQLEPVS